MLKQLCWRRLRWSATARNQIHYLAIASLMGGGKRGNWAFAPTVCVSASKTKRFMGDKRHTCMCDQVSRPRTASYNSLIMGHYIVWRITVSPPFRTRRSQSTPYVRKRNQPSTRLPASGRWCQDAGCQWSTTGVSQVARAGIPVMTPRVSQLSTSDSRRSVTDADKHADACCNTVTWFVTVWLATLQSLFRSL